MCLTSPPLYYCSAKGKMLSSYYAVFRAPVSATAVKSSGGEDEGGDEYDDEEQEEDDNDELGPKPMVQPKEYGEDKQVQKHSHSFVVMLLLIINQNICIYIVSNSLN